MTIIYFWYNYRLSNLQRRQERHAMAYAATWLHILLTSCHHLPWSTDTTSIPGKISGLISTSNTRAYSLNIIQYIVICSVHVWWCVIFVHALFRTTNTQLIHWLSHKLKHQFRTRAGNNDLSYAIFFFKFIYRSH